MVGPERAIDRTPTTIRMAVTNSEKLSATTSPKLLVLRFHNSAAAIAAPASPIKPSGPIGIRSPGERNASAVIAAIAAAITQAIGMIALRALIGAPPALRFARRCAPD